MTRLFWTVQLLILTLFSFLYLSLKLGDEGYLNFFKTLHTKLRHYSGSYYDLKFQFRGPQEVDKSIVIVAIDEASIENEGRWPWKRKTMAELTDSILDQDPRVVGFDIVFAEPEFRIPQALESLLESQGLGYITRQFASDELLIESVKEHQDRVVLGWAADLFCRPKSMSKEDCPVGDSYWLKQLPINLHNFSVPSFRLEKDLIYETPIISFFRPVFNIEQLSSVANYAGYFNSVPDPDGSIRRISPVMLGDGLAFPSLALSMASLSKREKVRLSLDSGGGLKELKLGEQRIPASRRGDLEINFGGPAFSFPYVSASDLLSEEVSTSVAETLKDSHVFIGLTALGLQDIRSFPMDSVSPGVEGHAWFLENILNNNFLRTESLGQIIGIFFFMLLGGLALTYLLLKASAFQNVLVVLGSLIGLALIDQILLFENSYNFSFQFAYLEIFALGMFAFGYRFFEEEKHKKFVQSAFGHYLSKEVADWILKNPDSLHLGGEKKELALLFSDLRDFTKISESMDPTQLSRILNDYMSMMSEVIVEQESGTLDKFIGDAIMAFWGAPVPVEASSDRALSAALEMQRKLENNRSHFMEHYGVELRQGIGLHFGEATVGNMGSEKIFNYTAIGDAVNLASRLEALTKDYKVGIIASSAFIESLSASMRSKCEIRSLERTEIRGKSKKVEIFAINYL